jgi:hypothetical protein
MTINKMSHLAKCSRACNGQGEGMGEDAEDVDRKYDAAIDVTYTASLAVQIRMSEWRNRKGEA